MRRSVFVTGGARSGKSGFAVRLAEETGLKLYYIATATAGDPEMEKRIARHRELRDERWSTVEEPLDPAGALSRFGAGDAAVVDCLTLWTTNLMMKDGGGDFEAATRAKAIELADAVKEFRGTVIVVTNEVGLGIVPENRDARLFRDAAGTVNRLVAEAADEAYLVVSGLPVKIK